MTTKCQSVLMVLCLVLSGALSVSAQAPNQPAPGETAPRPASASFEPLERWMRAVLEGDSAAIQSFYCTDPAPTINAPSEKNIRAAAEAAFWANFKKEGLTAIRLVDLERESPRPDAEQVLFQLELTSGEGAAPPKQYLPAVHIWLKQAGAWHILFSQRLHPTRLKQPLRPDENLYRADADANAQIAAVCSRAASDRKRVLLVFGANWCYDCHVLEGAFHRPDIAPLLNGNFEIVHVDIGQGERNLDLVQRYDVPLEKGVPALVVLESDGRMLFSQKQGEFASARVLGPEEVIEFLNRWKPLRLKP